MEDLERFETALGARLPEDYRTFLTTDSEYLRWWGEGREMVYSRLWCPGAQWHDHAKFDGFSELKELRLPDAWTVEDSIDIGSDYSGKRYGLSFRESDFGSIYYCNDDVGLWHDGEHFERDESFVVAKSFTEFRKLIDPPSSDVGDTQL